MDPRSQDAWKREALDMAFEALATCSELSDKIVYKGGRVLALRLGGEQRASYDLDANILLSFAVKTPDREEQSRILSDLFGSAISDYASNQDPVRYELTSVAIKHRPRSDHPMGWNAFDVKVQLRDYKLSEVRNLPSIEFDVAAPEKLGDSAVAPLQVDGHEVFAYTLERIAGEKLRAFLSSLPCYRAKVKKPGSAVRAKDLYDLHKILQAKPIEHSEFWHDASKEFRLACESRYVDCLGLSTFSEDIEVTRTTYDTDSTLPGDVTFDDAWMSLEVVVRSWESLSVFPQTHPLPEESQAT